MAKFEKQGGFRSIFFGDQNLSVIFDERNARGKHARRY